MVLRTMPYKILGCGISDIGLVRQNNEDAWTILPKLNFYVIADGMGGHRAGEIASKEAIGELGKIIQKSVTSLNNLSLEEAHGIVQLGIEQMNVIVYNMGQNNKELRGMGTTLCCLLFHPEGVIYGNVGDSRIYRLRDKKLEQITRDHSLLRDLVDLGQVREDQSGEFMYKNIITRAIGTEPFVEPSVHITDLIDGDIYLMCTDGLSDLVSQKEMEKILNQEGSIEDHSQKLVAEAIQKGGVDNITVVLTKVQEYEAKDLSR